MPPISGSLQSDKTRELRAQFDKVRHTNIGRKVGVPIILVVGDQDSGKSATVTSITGVPFPSADGCCTRHATEIVLRWARGPNITASVTPDPESPELPKKMREVLAKYHVMQSLDELPALQKDFQ